jgi:hypothetical protein
MKNKLCGNWMPVAEKPEEMLLVYSTAEEVELFMKTPLYQDYLREIDIQIKLLDNALFDPDLEYTGRHYDLFRGAKRKALDLKDMFVNLLEALKLEEEGEE